ncbi:MAG: sulfotransferase [Thermodesulfobacteriota bacterium]
MKIYGKVKHHKLLTQIDLRLHGILVPFLLKLYAPKDYNMADTLVIAGAPRAGTTWLAELVNMVPESAILFEPLHLGQVSAARRAGFKWETMVPRGASWPEGENFLQKVLLGKVRNRWTMSHVTLQQARHARVWIVKFVRANMMLDWFAHTFPVRPPALIIRHPCACIASYLQKGWPRPAKAPADHAFFQVYPHLRQVCNGLVSVEEYIAVSWCMEYYVPFVAQPPMPFHLVCYERLVRTGLEELTKLFKVWELPLPEEAKVRLQRPSTTTATFSQVSKGRDPLTGWQRYFTPEQSRRILAVVEAFGLDFYSNEPEPDYERLYSQSPVRQNMKSDGADFLSYMTRQQS